MFLSRILTLVGVLILPAMAAEAAVLDIVPLEYCYELPVNEGETLVGLATPSVDGTLPVRLYELGLVYENMTVCKAPWERVLPELTPWSPEAGFDTWHGWAVFGVALILMLIISQLLPKAWRRYVTVLGLLALFVGTWALGVVGLKVLNQMELPQTLLYGNVIAIQRGAGEVEWLEVDGIRDLDRALIHRGLKPAVLKRGGKAKVGERDVVITGQQRIQGDQRQLEVAKPMMSDPAVADSADTVAEATTATAPSNVPNDTVPASKVEADPTPAFAWADVAWVSAAEVSILDLAPAIIDPVGKHYRVHQALNLRSSPGIQHARSQTLVRDSWVTVIGPIQGNWWKVKTADGSEGWVSSLWLRSIVD